MEGARNNGISTYGEYSHGSNRTGYGHLKRMEEGKIPKTGQREEAGEGDSGLNALIMYKRMWTIQPLYLEDTEDKHKWRNISMKNEWIFWENSFSIFNI